ncbi:MAG: SDR family oxidoreductase [Thalassobaculaceae bacterium]|nr:SDR family oxidoreductase [Thalassobaculaceae bacterium]
MDLLLSDKTALISGASSGIGRSAALLLAREGAKVIIHGRREAALQAVIDDVVKAGAPAPVAVTGDLDSVVGCAGIADRALDAAGGAVDILINNAGGSRPMEDPWDEAFWEASFKLNFEAARRLSAAVVPGMKERRWGRIINVTGAMVGSSMNAAMPAKAALQSWSRTMSLELAPFGITVNTIAPGRIHSEQIDNRLHPTEESRQAFIDRYIPAGYFGEPEDLAILMVFLASPLARYISGAAIPVDGAMVRVG